MRGQHYWLSREDNRPQIIHEHTGGQVQTRELTGRILKGELQPPKDEDA